MINVQMVWAGELSNQGCPEVLKGSSEAIERNIARTNLLDTWLNLQFKAESTSVMCGYYHYP